MIQWKQRLYAFLLRRVLGPFLDTPSKLKLHESIEVSFHEGTFTLNSVGLCTAYINSLLLQKDATIIVRKVRVQTISIQLSLHEESHADGRDQYSLNNNRTHGKQSSSLAWRAMNLGSSVALIAHVEINGVELEVEPRPASRPSNVDAAIASASSNTPLTIPPAAVPSSSTDDQNPTSMFSSYIDGALASLRLTCNVKNLKFRLREKPKSHPLQDGLALTHCWVELRLPSVSYQDVDSPTQSTPNTDAFSPRSNSKTILHKAFLFHGLSIHAGNTTKQQQQTGTIDSTVEEALSLVSTVAFAEGSGHIRIHAHEFQSFETKSSNVRFSKAAQMKQVQQEIDIQLNHQLKISVDETSLLQLSVIVNGFQQKPDDNDETDTEADNIQDELEEIGALGEVVEDDQEPDPYSTEGIMKQYEEARKLAERNELRGGILVPSHAYEEGSAAAIGDSRTFDVFFDANDKSFHNYASMMKDSILSVQDGGGSVPDFVHTKLRLSLLGGGIKVRFRRRTAVQMPCQKSEEYILLNFNDVNISSSVSLSGADHSLTIAHLEIDDARLPLSEADENDTALAGDDCQVEIGSLLNIAQQPDYEDDNIVGGSDIMVQPSCLTLRCSTVKQTGRGGDQCDLECNVKPLEFTYRQRTMSNLSNLIALLCDNTAGGVRTGRKHRTTPNDDTAAKDLHLNCNFSSITVNFPVTKEGDFSALFTRCLEPVDGSTAAGSSIGVVLDHVSFEHHPKPQMLSQSDCRTQSNGATTFECHSFLLFAVSLDKQSPSFAPKVYRMDIAAATGLLEVEPYIPIAVEYRRNDIITPESDNHGRRTFPVVPTLSKFKTRQEDEDEDDEIERLLSAKLHGVEVDTRRSLRAKDPQSPMQDAAGGCVGVVQVHTPEILCDLTIDELVALTQMVSGIITTCTVESNTEQPFSPPPSSKATSAPIAVSVACDAVTISVHSGSSSQPSSPSLWKDKQNTEIAWNSHLLRLDRCRLHTILAGSGKQLRFFSHEITFFEVENLVADITNLVQSVQDRVDTMKERGRRTSNSSAVPILYRSQLLPAISQASPSFLIDIVQPGDAPTQDNVAFVERSVFISVYNVTFRFDPISKWMERLQLVISAAADSVGPGKPSSPEISEVSDEFCTDATELTRVFISVSDSNIDYTSPMYFNTASRSIVRVGDLRLSSNIVCPAGSVQAASLCADDVSVLLCNKRYPYNFENSLLGGAELVMRPEDVNYKLTYMEASSYSPPATVFHEMNLKTILTIESIDAIIAKNRINASGIRAESSLPEAKVTVNLTLGELSLYACKDSFQCFAETIGELQTKLTALSDEDVRQIKEASTDEPHEEDPAGQETFFDSRSDHDPADLSGVPPVPTDLNVAATGLETQQHSSPAMTAVESDAEFLLDGYDWTAIDHDSFMAAEIPPGDEQVARWLTTPSHSPTGEEAHDPYASCSHPAKEKGPRICINNQHFPLFVATNPLDDGDMGAAQLARTKSVAVETRVLVHDMRVKLRFFDGYDWPEYRKQQKKPSRNTAFVIEEPENDEGDGGDTAPILDQAYISDKKSKLMGELLTGATDNTSTFRDMPLPEERGEILLSQAEIRRLSRRTSSYLQVSASEISARVDSFGDSKDHRLKSCIDLKVDDLFLAETISHMNPLKMIGEWFNEHEHPRDSKNGLLMLKMVTWNAANPVTPDNELANDDCEIAIELAPLRCILDQRAIQFSKAFFAAEVNKPNGGGSNWNSGLHEIPPPFLRMFRVKPVKLKIDYTPKKLDVAALKNGCIVEFVNLSPLDGMVLTLHQVEVEGVVGVGEAVGSLVSHWLQDICATQLHKFLTNARPLEPISSISGGVADLFVVPWDAYKNGERVSRAVRSSLSSLASTVASETLTTSSRLTEFIAGEVAKVTASSLAPNTISQNTLPSRPLETPRGLGDTAGHALESLARGVQTANYKIVIVPYREYRRSGAKRAAKSVLKGIPVAIAAPVSGASEALSYTLLGARNQIRPDIRKEEERMQRGLHYGGHL